MDTKVQRLVDTKVVSSREEGRLAELVAASERTTLSDESKADVLNKVLARQARHHRRPSWAVRPAFASLVFLLAGVTAAATVGRHWIAEKLTASPAPALTPPAATATAPRARPAPAIEAPQPVIPSPPAIDEAPLAPAHPSASARRSRAGRGEDPSRVVAAIQTLRNDHDPVRAGKLLDEYLKVYPHGALAEEALALSIEAAAARHDASRAAAFADRYLREYPNGRFRHAAEQARQPPAP